MSYCVNCGVELSDSQAQCPLCGQQVVNPAAPVLPGEGKAPYPASEPRVSPKFKSGLAALLAALILLIPIGLCLFNDFSDDGRISWSLLVSGGTLLLFIIVFGPFLFQHYRPLLSTFVDGVSVTGYLFLIEYVTGGHWFLRFALPLAAVATVFASLFVFLITRKKHVGFFVKVGSLLLLCGAYTVAIEWCVSDYFETARFSGWSVYACVPCIIIGVVAFILHGSPAVKEELRRRFFI